MRQVEGITLLEGEEVKLVIHRAVIGVVLIWLAVAAAIAVLAILSMTVVEMALIIWMVNVFLILVGVVWAAVYRGNRMVVTTKRVIHRRTPAPFAVFHEVIDLESIEDVSLRREGVWQYICRVGTIRMATVGDETTYTFRFVNTPQDEVDLITQLVSAAKTEGDGRRQHSRKH
jgi:hypothetical protein